MTQAAPYDQRNYGQQNQNYSNGGNQQNQQNRPVDLRVILTRDEVEFLFGFDGNLINQLRQQTGAHIQITDGDSFEYVLLIRGSDCRYQF